MAVIILQLPCLRSKLLGDWYKSVRGWGKRLCEPSRVVRTDPLALRQPTLKGLGGRAFDLWWQGIESPK